MYASARVIRKLAELALNSGREKKKRITSRTFQLFAPVLLYKTHITLKPVCKIFEYRHTHVCIFTQKIEFLKIYFLFSRGVDFFFFVATKKLLLLDLVCVPQYNII